MAQERKYAIRKLSVGVASVAVGTVVAGADVVYAEEVEMLVEQDEVVGEVMDEVTDETESLSQLQFTEEENAEETVNVNAYSGGGNFC